MRTTKQDKPISEDPRLLCVNAKRKQLLRELQDAEWNEDPREDSIRKEFKHYDAMLKLGIYYEPKF